MSLAKVTCSLFLCLLVTACTTTPSIIVKDELCEELNNNILFSSKTPFEKRIQRSYEIFRESPGCLRQDFFPLLVSFYAEAFRLNEKRLAQILPATALERQRDWFRLIIRQALWSDKIPRLEQYAKADLGTILSGLPATSAFVRLEPLIKDKPKNAGDFDALWGRYLANPKQEYIETIIRGLPLALSPFPEMSADGQTGIWSLWSNAKYRDTTIRKIIEKRAIHSNEDTKEILKLILANQDKNDWGQEEFKLLRLKALKRRAASEKQNQLFNFIVFNTPAAGDTYRKIVGVAQTPEDFYTVEAGLASFGMKFKINGKEVDHTRNKMDANPRQYIVKLDNSDFVIEYDRYSFGPKWYRLKLNNVEKMLDNTNK